MQQSTPVIPVPVLTEAAVLPEWGLLTTPVSVKLAILDLDVELTLMTASLLSAQTTAYAWME